MSVVYRAVDDVERRDVALKVMRLSDEDRHDALHLQQEFRSMSRLVHPGLVRVFDYGFIEESAPYLTMELLPGEDLAKTGRLPLELLYQVLASLAEVLGFIHARGYVHRDVKPSNVRLLPTEPGQPPNIRLMDCGLTEEQGKVCSSVAGTLVYLAPEGWLGASTDARADLYSLGVLAYEMCCGQLPFDASTGMRLLKSKTERPKDLRELCPDVPPAFARLVCDLLAPEPANRPVSATEVLSRLKQFTSVRISSDPLTYLAMPALVGRSRELKQLRSALFESASQKAVVMTLIGPAGVGKTRLFDEALLEAGLRGVIIARSKGRGFSSELYGVYHELLDSLCRRVKGEGPAMRGERPSVPSGSRTERATTEPASARRALIRDFGDVLIEASRERRVLLAVDDLYLADAASLDVLCGVLSEFRGGNVALLGTLRTGERRSASLDRLMCHSEKLSLAAMTKDQIGELIASAFGPTQLSDALLTDLERVTDGNVYFVLETLRELAARGLIEKRRTFVHLPDSLDGIELPRTLSEALTRRVRSLSPRALQMARICAVAGRAVEWSLACRLLGEDEEGFLDALDELRRFEVLRVVGDRLSLHHARLQDALLEGIRPQSLELIHLRVAEAMERQGTAIRRDCAAELGHHFAEAKEFQRAIGYLMAAGDARYEGSAYADASAPYRRAYELRHVLAEHERALLETKLSDRLGRICLTQDHGSGPGYLEQARKSHLSYGYLRWIEPLGRFIGVTSALVVAVGLTVLRDLLRGRRHPWRKSRDHLSGAFSATTYLANCYTYSGRINRALEAADRLRPLVFSGHKLPQLGYQLARAPALGLAGRFDEVVADCEKALRILERPKNVPLSTRDIALATGGALITLVWVDLSRGSLRGSKYFSRFESFVMAHPTGLMESWLLEARLFVAYRRGQLDEARKAWEQLADKSSHVEDQFVQNKARVWLGRALLDFGLVNEAQDVTDEVIARAEQQDNPLLRAMGLQLRGLAYVAWEQLDEAAQCYDEALSLAQHPDVGATEFYHAVMLNLASLEIRRKRYALARLLATQVDKGISGLSLTHDLHRLQVARIQGHVAIVEGARAQGLELLQLALMIARTLEDKLEEAYCLFELSSALATSDPTGREQARLGCEQILLGLGNGYQLRRLGLRGAEEPVSSGRDGVLYRVKEWALAHPEFGRTVPTVSSVRSRDESNRDDTLPAVDSCGSALEYSSSPT